MAHNYLRCYIGLPIYLFISYLESHQDIQMWFFIKSCNIWSALRSRTSPCTVWSGSAGRTRPELNFCVLIKELRCDLTHTLQLNTMRSSQQHTMQLSLCHFLLHHIHIQIDKNKYNEIYMCIHTNTHAQACHHWFHLKMDSGRVCCRRVCLWVCETLSLGCVCGTCCRLVRYVNEKRDVGNAFIQTPKHTHTRTLSHVHILKNMCSGVQKPHLKFWDSTFQIWK